MAANILVTGGAGYIGSHTCKALAAAGFAPVVFDNLERGHRDAVKWGPLVVGDTRNLEDIERAIAEHSPAAVMHFAAYAYVGESFERPLDYYRNNVGGIINLLSACRRGGVNEIIFSSSCATYGLPDVVPIVEDAPQLPVSPYGRSKLMCEQVLADAAASHGLRYMALRYFNASGADADGELAERHDPETHLIPRALMATAGSIPALEIFGTDYPTPDGTCVRDYVHVTDLADAHVKALQNLLGGGQTRNLNLGAGRGFSILEICARIAEETARAVPHKDAPRRPGDPPSLYSDVSAAKALIGFEPANSDLGTIIRTAAPAFGLELPG